MSKSIDITGRHFDRLEAVHVDHVHNGQEYWLCKCECGAEHIVRKSHLLGGRVRSCGCLYKGKKRGVSQTPTYVVCGNYVRGVDFKGNSFFCDLDDFDLIRPYNWYLNHDGYVVARIAGKNVTMHTYLLKEQYVDHANWQKVDNRRNNLRKASNSENAANMPPYSGHIKGVRWMQRNNKYAARISWKKHEIHLGMFRNYEDAVRARLLAEQRYFGEFAPQKALFKQYGIEV